MIKKAIKIAKTKKEIKKILYKCSCNNKFSMKLAESLGFEKESVAKKQLKIGGRYYDEIYYFKFIWV